MLVLRTACPARGPVRGGRWLVLAFVVSQHIKAPGLGPVGLCFKGQQKIEILDSSPGARCASGFDGPGHFVTGLNVGVFSLFHDATLKAAGRRCMPALLGLRIGPGPGCGGPKRHGLQGLPAARV